MPEHCHSFPRRLAGLYFFVFMQWPVLLGNAYFTHCPILRAGLPQSYKNWFLLELILGQNWRRVAFARPFSVAAPDPNCICESDRPTRRADIVRVMRTFHDS